MFDARLARRVFFGLIMAACLLGLLIGEAWLSAIKLPLPFRGIGFGIIAGLLGCVAMNELLDMMRDGKFMLVGWVMFVGMMAGTTIPFWVPQQYAMVGLGGVMAMILLVAALCQGMLLGPDAAFRHLGFVSFATIYLVIGFFFMVSIRLLGVNGSGWAGQMGPVVTYLAIVKCADVGAYLTGRAIGKHKWVPSISPNKTWEGLAGGLILGILAGLLCARIFSLMPITKALISSLIIGITGQLGDLLESMLKRDSQIKDSANVVPEFGGILDLIDSPIAAAPVAYFVFVLLM